jgi:hypothetical protein
MSGKRRPWLHGLALGLSLASLAGAQSLSHDPGSRVSRASLPRDGGVCGPTSITESATQNIISGNSIACTDPMSGFTFENHYWRAFDLPTFGINGGFDVCEVQIAVEAALSVGGTQPLSVSLYSTTVGAFPAGTLTPIGNASLSVPDQDQTLLTVPITGSVPPDSALVVEVVSPDGTGDLFAFYIGSNADGQTAPSYLSALSCGIAAPTDLATLGYPDMHIVMTVRGTESAINPTALDVDKAGNGVLEIGETAVVAPSWTNSGPSPITLTGSASNLTGPAGPAYTIPDGTADYGTVSSSARNNCFDATGDCYTVDITGPRPQQHFDATMDEAVVPVGAPLDLPNLIAKTWTLHVGGSFGDVSPDIVADPYYPSIETIFHNGVTAGCHAGTEFCPTDPTTRQEMAVFLLKADNGSTYDPPDCTTPDLFTDVTCTPAVGFSDWIENLYNLGITAGCQAPGDPLAYCPTRNVLRSEMAVFLLKTSLGSAYDPPDCVGLFSDVPCTPGVGFSDWIENLYNLGITAGCQGPGDPLAYCPNDNVLRQEMAAFLTRTFGLVLYGP